MEDLLPFYERELGFLRNSSREFARRYPKITAGLGLSGETCEDPHIERLIESFALLTARVNKKLEDDYPEFTEALFEVLYPHYLRPFPSCSIVQFDLGKAVAELKQATTIPRGTELASQPIFGVPCKFSTVYDVDLSPVVMDKAHYRATPSGPQNTVLPVETTGRFTFSLSLGDPALSFNKVGLSKLRCYLHGEASLVASIRDSLFMQVMEAYAEMRPGFWRRLDRIPVGICGLEEDESLIDFPPSSHPAYRLLTENFAFPEKFNFFDLHLDELKEITGKATSVTIHLLVRNIPADSNTARLLETMTADNIRLWCTPVINLFEQIADPIRITQATASYTILADSKSSFAYEIYSVDKVSQVTQSESGEKVIELHPFYSLHHGEKPDENGGYWTLSQDRLLAEKSPGYETEITIVDSNLDPLVPKVDTLSIKMTCTNRNTPLKLAIGQPEGDLTMGDAPVAHTIKLLRRPTKSVRFAKGRGVHWRLISHLALNHLSLVESGLPALKETLRLYDLTNSAVSARQMEGIVGLDYSPITHWMEGEPFATFVRGIEIRLTINQEHFVGTSLHTFVSVLNRFFGLYVHTNSFIQLVILSSDGSELLRCQPCSGDSILV